MEKETIIVGNGNDMLGPEITTDLPEVLTDTGFNMNIISKFMDPSKSVSHEDIAAFRFGPLHRLDDESFEDYKSRQKAEKFMLGIRHKFGIRMNPAGTYVKGGEENLDKKTKKARKRWAARGRKRLAAARGAKRIYY